jgi:Acyl-CoA oxidase
VTCIRTQVMLTPGGCGAQSITTSHHTSPHLISSQLLLFPSRSPSTFTLAFTMYQSLPSPAANLSVCLPACLSICDTTSVTSTFSFYSVGALEGFLCKRVRTDSLSLIEAWQFSDQRLDSTLGRSDGKVKQNLLSVWRLVVWCAGLRGGG